MSTEEQILKGAEELFFRYGIKGITMDDVAKHLSMSKRTIYEKFPHKEAIVEILLKEHLEKHLSDCKKYRNAATNAIEEIFMMLTPIKELFAAMNPRLLFELKKFHPKAWQDYVEFKRTTLMESMISNMKRGIKEGLYRDDIDVNVLAILRIEEVEIAWNQEIYPSAKFDLAKVHISLLEHFLFGITNIKGHQMAEKFKKNLNE
ncbi:MAG TPA: TetR/AcrR family transcriptional regulator [Bacteroidia bacterium]|jgi:AcrR family transcriptional regulator|nr:TetR/AcrR family transcriptional regulator [Bacteroidia bacterium]